MKKSTKIWLGIATIWPVVYMFLFFAAIMLIFALADAGSGVPGSPDSALFPAGIMGLMAVHMITIFGSLALTVFYIVRVFKTEQLDQNMRIMWTLLMFFFGMLAQPVFWYLYIWRDVPAGGAPGQPQRLLSPGMRASQGDWESKKAEYVPPPEPPDWR